VGKVAYKVAVDSAV